MTPPPPRRTGPPAPVRSAGPPAPRRTAPRPTAPVSNHGKTITEAIGHPRHLLLENLQKDSGMAPMLKAACGKTGVPFTFRHGGLRVSWASALVDCEDCKQTETFQIKIGRG